MINIGKAGKTRFNSFGYGQVRIIPHLKGMPKAGVKGMRLFLARLICAKENISASGAFKITLEVARLQRQKGTLWIVAGFDGQNGKGIKDADYKAAKDMLLTRLIKSFPGFDIMEGWGLKDGAPPQVHGVFAGHRNFLLRVRMK